MKKNNWLGLMAVVVLAVCAVGYLASPVLALNSLRSALKTGDRDALERLVDFPSVRDSLKSQFRAQLLKSMGSDQSMRDNPLAGLAMLAAPAIVDQVLETAVTPEGLSTLIRQGRINQTNAAGASARPAADSDRAADPPLRAEHLRYRDLDTFKADIVSADGKGAVTVVLRRQGLFGWQVKRLDLPEGILNDSPSTPAAGPAEAAEAAADGQAAQIRQEAPGALQSAADAVEPPTAVMTDGVDFGDYPAAGGADRVVFPDFDGAQRDQREFRTRIREGFAGGPNFAGHMVLTEIGCGAGCRWVSVGDAATGALSNFPLGGEDNYMLDLRYSKASALVKARWQGQGSQPVCYGRDLAWTGAGFKTVRDYSAPGDCPQQD